MATVKVAAHANESVPVNQVQVWDNGTKLGWYAGTDVNQYYSLAPGSHTLTVVDLDSSFNPLHQSSVTYTVQPGVQIISPTPNQSVGMTTVKVAAHANESVPVNQVQVWDNGTKLGWYPGTNVNQLYSLAPGSHKLTVLDLDSNFNLLHQSTVFYSVQ
jgi:hypothetical protein